MKQLIIKQNDAGQRLDSFIRKTFPKLSLLSIQKYIRTKNIKVNDKKSENKYRLVLGDEIKLYINDEFLTHSNLKTD
jgi:23S rRNA pseudouridine955/2504/2580 synthase